MAYYSASALRFDGEKVAVDRGRLAHHEGIVKRLEAVHLATVGAAFQVACNPLDELAAADCDAA